MPVAAPIAGETLPLRDIHLPPPISWWPPAPGWWFVLFFSLLLLGLLYWTWQRRQRRRYQRLLLAQLQELELNYRQQADEDQLLQSLSRLLRQAVQLHFPTRNNLGLVGEAWLEYLDQTLAGKDFSQGAGRVLALGPYQRQTPEIDAPALFKLCRRWLRRLPPAAKSGRQG